MKLLIVPAILAALALHASVASADGGCHAIFVGGVGVVDSCTGNHRSPYPDPPPQPTIIYVDVTFSPEINVNVSNVVNAISSSSSYSSAGAAASTNNTTYVVKPRIKKAKP